MVSSKEILDTLMFRVQKEFHKENILLKFSTQEEITKIKSSTTFLNMLSKFIPKKKEDKDIWKVSVWVDLNGARLFEDSSKIFDMDELQSSLESLYDIMILNFMVYATRQLLANGYAAGGDIISSNLDVETIEEL